MSTENTSEPRHDAVTMWRCRECGKFSDAKRDPIRHKIGEPVSYAEREEALAGIGTQFGSSVPF